MRVDGQGTCDLAHVLEWVISDRVPAQRSENRAIQDTSDKPVQSNNSNDRKPPRQGTLPRAPGRKGSADLGESSPRWDDISTWEDSVSGRSSTFSASSFLQWSQWHICIGTGPDNNCARGWTLWGLGTAHMHARIHCPRDGASERAQACLHTSERALVCWGCMPQYHIRPSVTPLNQSSVGAISHTDGT